MLKLGTQNISGLYVGEHKIKKAFVGSDLVFEDNPTYTVYFYAVDEEDSSKVLNSSSFTVNPGESVSVYPWDINGYNFVGWYDESGNLVSSGSSFSVTPTGDATYYLKYYKYCTLLVSASGFVSSELVVTINGEDYSVIRNADAQGTGTELRLRKNTVVTVKTKTIPSGYKFDNWKLVYANVTSTSDPYTFTMTRDTEILHGYLSKASRLPAGYTELEYVQSSNTTTVSSASSIVFPSVANAAACYCKFSINSNLVTSNTVTSEFMLFGYQYRNASNLCQLYSLALYNSNIVMWQRYYKSSNVVRSPVTLAPQALNTIYEFYSNSSTQKTTLNGNVVSGYIYPTFYGKGTSHVCNVLFGQCYTSGTDVSNTAVKGIRIYEFKMMDENDGILLHLIPCKDPSGKIGMYDIIGKAFYANAKGTFLSASTDPGSVTVNTSYPLIAGPAV